ncbi:26S proteasome non-ATPase regulatory subunit 4, partial [Tanacetum coccineum]
FHPENCVGILAMGDTVYDLVKPTRDLQKIMSSIHGALIDNDSMSILDALERAQFVGNNMMYKRIVIFAGGLKRRVAVDVINLGDKDGPRAGVCEDWRDVFKDNIIPRRKSLILSRIRWEQCCSSNSFESIIARQKVQIDALTQDNEKQKRELEFFRTASLNFVRKNCYCCNKHDAEVKNTILQIVDQGSKFTSPDWQVIHGAVFNV